MNASYKGTCVEIERKIYTTLRFSYFKIT